MKKHIEERNEGFLTAENPILCDRYLYKLNLLKNKLDLAQEGKLTYEAPAQDPVGLMSIKDTNMRYERRQVVEEPQKNFVLDTSVLVKSSQIHPNREKYLQLLEQLRRNDTEVNRLGVPVPHQRKRGQKNHHKQNLEYLKKVFRNKSAVLPYDCPELATTPFEKIDEETKVRFSLEKLMPA